MLYFNEQNILQNDIAAIRIRNKMITVFYDGKCGLCSKEINHYRKIAPEGIFDWQDITESADDLKKEGVSLSDGLKLLHAKDHTGQLHIGVDAFILISKQLKRWRILSTIIGLPIIRQIANLVYRAFANWRFKRLDHCQLAAKEEE
uniref:Thiol-disulfide oxidoreductase n=1 Tax=Candidatus Berkiella cookevillensis TaxID=437022 RepID=A0A0Q9YGG6_9GAMM